MSALAAYRQLLRSMRLAFRGDATMLTAANASARQGFDMNRHLEPASKETADSVQHALEVAKILRQNIVQGQRIGGDDTSATYKLNIHEETERGDNNSIKVARGQSKISGSGCCQDIKA